MTRFAILLSALSLTGCQGLLFGPGGHNKTEISATAR